MLSGPPLIGLLGDHIGILPALWLPALVMLGSLLLTPIVGKPERREAKKGYTGSRARSLILRMTMVLVSFSTPGSSTSTSS